MRRLLQAGEVAPPAFMLDDRGVHAMRGTVTLCGTEIMDFDPEYGPLQECFAERATCRKCRKAIRKEEKEFEEGLFA